MIGLVQAAGLVARPVLVPIVAAVLKTPGLFRIAAASTQRRHRP
jgi:hypothetical protein